MSAPSRRCVASLLALALAGACRAPEPPPDAPDVLWIVWDTVRADRLGPYGAEPQTTPHLDRFAAGARVFEDCLATAPTTVPNHAAMFTGLLPAEHGASNAQPRLSEAHATLAQRLASAGYRTWLWSANPHVARGSGLARGFQRVAHPWDRAHRASAIAHARRKLAGGDGSGLARDLAQPRVERWAVKESGTLAQQALLDWLDALPRDARWFAFLNYMEAHRPVVPERRFRERVMDADTLARSYTLDRSWDAVWRYSFGLDEIAPGDLAVLAATYDAALAELDALLGALLAALEARGHLADAVVVLTSDHGEHLGEHHLLDHQYSLYEPLLRVPLLIRSARLEPGRDPRPVMNFDLFPTLLALTGAGAVDPSSRAVSLLAPLAARARLAEYRAPFEAPLRDVLRRAPGFDPTPWRRRLRALHADGYKLIRGSDGSRALYHVARDPGETRDLHDALPGRAAAMHARLDAVVGDLGEATPGGGRPAPALSREAREQLEALGYGAAPPPPTQTEPAASGARPRSR